MKKETNFIEELRERLALEKRGIKSKIVPPEPLYSVGQPILVMFESKASAGVVAGLKHIFHWRKRKYSWGYDIDFKAERVGPLTDYIPEEYINKVMYCRERVPTNKNLGRSYHE